MRHSVLDRSFRRDAPVIASHSQPKLRRVSRDSEVDEDENDGYEFEEAYTGDRSPRSVSTSRSSSSSTSREPPKLSVDDFIIENSSEDLRLWRKLLSNVRTTADMPGPWIKRPDLMGTAEQDEIEPLNLGTKVVPGPHMARFPPHRSSFNPQPNPQPTMPSAFNRMSYAQATAALPRQSYQMPVYTFGPATVPSYPPQPQPEPQPSFAYQSPAQVHPAVYPVDPMQQSRYPVPPTHDPYRQSAHRSSYQHQLAQSQQYLRKAPEAEYARVPVAAPPRRDDGRRHGNTENRSPPATRIMHPNLLQQHIFHNPLFTDADGNEFGGARWNLWMVCGLTRVEDIFKPTGHIKRRNLQELIRRDPEAIHQLDEIARAVERRMRVFK